MVDERSRQSAGKGLAIPTRRSKAWLRRSRCDVNVTADRAGWRRFEHARAWRSRRDRYNVLRLNINPIIGRCVVLVSCDHSFSERSHSVDVPGATGLPEAERPQGRKRPAQVKSDGELKSTRRPRREPRPARSRLHCFKPNPERMINGPAATLTLRRRVSGADPKRPRAGKTARYSDRGDEPGSRDEWAT
jgi:hypothetical protein